MGLRLLLLLAAAVAGPALTEAQVRDFIAGQERAWNRGDLAAYFASFTPDAVFVDQALGSDNAVRAYGRSTLAEARAQSRRAVAKGPIEERGRIVRIRLAPDGRSAEVETFQTTRIAARTACGRRVQTLVLAGGRVRSRGETETVVRCRH